MSFGPRYLLVGCFACLLMGCTPPADEGGDGADESSDSTAADCTPGSMNCECVAGECLGELECVAGICTSDCTPGSIGCECVGGECLGDNTCVNGICMAPGDGDGDPTGDGDGDPTGDGDGDPTGDGDGDGDPTGDGDGDPTGDGDGDPTGDGDGESDTCENPIGALGCEFHAAKLPAGMLNWPLRITAANPGLEPASVRVEVRNGNDWTTVAGPLLVDPMDFHTFLFYSDAVVMSHGKHSGRAHRITSSRPIGVHQINASGSAGVSNLLPPHGWDHNYEVVAPASGYVVVVATVDGTTVAVQPSEPLLTSPDIPAYGAPFQVLLNAGESLGLFLFETGGNHTLTRTKISSDVLHPFVVFTGHRNNNDHLEEQLLGTSFVSTTHVGMRSSPQVLNANPYATRWSVYSLANATSLLVTAAPQVTGLPPMPTVLSQGQLYSFDPDGPTWGQAGDAVLTTSKTTFVFNSTRSTNNPGTTAFAQAPPLGSLTTRYAFALAAVNNSSVTFAVGYPVGSTITINGRPGVPVTPPFEFSAGWLVARYYYTTPGTYVLEGTEPFALNISGSYGYSYSTSGGVGNY